MISVIIPTHKPKFLEQTLSAIAGQSDDIIVVENPEWTFEVSSLCKQFGVKHAINSEVGANRARNLGIELAKYDYFCLLDDDCVPGPNHIKNAELLFKLKYKVLGGPLVCDIPDPPSWLDEYFRPVITELNWVPSNAHPFWIGIINGYLVSGNLCFDREIWEKCGPLEPEAGLIGRDNFVANDETRFLKRCYEHNMYFPLLRCKHLVDASRLNINFFIKRHYDQGYADAILWQEENKDKDIHSHLLVHHASSLIHGLGDKYNEVPEDEYNVWVRYVIKYRLARVLGLIDGAKKCYNKNTCLSLLEDVEPPS